ncbi:hypothetical protein LQK93_00092 [Terrabacter sp. BE26]
MGDPASVCDAFEAINLIMASCEGPDLRVTAANAAFRAFTGRTDVIGRPIRDLMPEWEAQRIVAMAERVYSSGQREVGREWRIQVEPEGAGEVREFFIDFTVDPHTDADGKVHGVVGHALDVTDRVVERHAAQRQAADAAHRYEAVRDVVAELQQVLLPADLPVMPRAALAARYLVAAQDQTAGGDWFDAVPLPGGALALVVGDVVGHGVAASAAMGRLRTLLHEMLRETGDVPGSLAKLDRIAARAVSTRAATVCVAVLDQDTGALTYTTCGHPQPLVVAADGSTRYLPRTGAGPLGTGSRPTMGTDALAAGEVLIVYSDGLIERPGRPLEAGMATLAGVAGDAVANRVMAEGAPRSVVDRICQQSVELLTREGYDDDVTVMAVQRRSRSVEPLHLDVPAGRAGYLLLRKSLAGWLDELDATPEDRSAVELAVSELAANIVAHAYAPDDAGPIRLDARLGDDGVLEIVVADEGLWQEPAPTPDDTSGRGLWMVGRLLDDLLVTHRDGAAGTVVTVRHRMHHPAVLDPEPFRPATPHDGGEFAAEIDAGHPLSLRVSGSLSFATASEFAEILGESSRGGVHPLVLDLTRVDVLASAGVNAIFSALSEHATHRHQLHIVAAAGTVPAQVLDLVGLPYTAVNGSAPTR